MKTKKTHGGKREGSGPKYKYGEPTTVISFKCPASAVCLFKKLIIKNLKKYEKNLPPIH